MVWKGKCKATMRKVALKIKLAAGISLPCLLRWSKVCHAVCLASNRPEGDVCLLKSYFCFILHIFKKVNKTAAVEELTEITWSNWTLLGSRGRPLSECTWTWRVRISPQSQADATMPSRSQIPNMQSSTAMQQLLLTGWDRARPSGLLVQLMLGSISLPSQGKSAFLLHITHYNLILYNKWKRTLEQCYASLIYVALECVRKIRKTTQPK